MLMQQAKGLIQQLIAPLLVAVVVGFVNSQFLLKELKITLVNHEKRLTSVEADTKAQGYDLAGLKAEVRIYHGSALASSALMNPRRAQVGTNWTGSKLKASKK